MRTPRLTFLSLSWCNVIPPHSLFYLHNVRPNVSHDVAPDCNLRLKCLHRRSSMVHSSLGQSELEPRLPFTISGMCLVHVQRAKGHVAVGHRFRVMGQVNVVFSDHLGRWVFENNGEERTQGQNTSYSFPLSYSSFGPMMFPSDGSLVGLQYLYESGFLAYTSNSLGNVTGNLLSPLYYAIEVGRAKHSIQPWKNHSVFRNLPGSPNFSGNVFRMTAEQFSLTGVLVNSKILSLLFKSFLNIGANLKHVQRASAQAQSKMEIPKNFQNFKAKRIVLFADFLLVYPSVEMGRDIPEWSDLFAIDVILKWTVTGIFLGLKFVEAACERRDTTFAQAAFMGAGAKLELDDVCLSKYQVVKLENPMLWTCSEKIFDRSQASLTISSNLCLKIVGVIFVMSEELLVLDNELKPMIDSQNLLLCVLNKTIAVLDPSVGSLEAFMPLVRL
ncbi:hypothetical protein Tco_0417012 [Tanacetum coccineum]